ncbi:MAG: PTS sugar transporter subunit IIA [Candidatus Cloacimonadota bacterium]|nr:MAG: PTS sugar transporter subunit IIA [Candidatus Cloacimonadota bacterium]
MDIAKYLRLESIALDIKCKNKKGIIEKLADLILKDDKVGNISKSELLHDILKREELGSTGIGEGVALPHIHAEISDITMAFIRSKNKIDFDALDNQPCQIFFMIVAPVSKNSEYLKLLATISRIMKKSANRKTILNLKTPEQVRDFLGEF